MRGEKVKYDIGDELLVKVKVTDLATSQDIYGVTNIDNPADNSFTRKIFVDEKDVAVDLQKSAEETWELAKEIISMDKDKLLDIFDIGDLYYVFRGNSPQEAKEKIKKWEDKNKIDIGDEVRLISDPTNNDYKFFVTFIDRNSEEISGVSLFDGGTFALRTMKYYEKTGRHIDVNKIVDEVKEDQL